MLDRFQLPSGGFLVALLIAIVLITALAWVVSSRSKHTSQAAPFAKVIVQPGSSIGVEFGYFLLIVFSCVCALMYISAETVLQQSLAVMIWIGNNTFWGTFIIAGSINRNHTYVVYSEVALNVEKNIARLEKLQEQANCASAVAAAIKPSVSVGADVVAEPVIEKKITLA